MAANYLQSHGINLQSVMDKAQERNDKESTGSAINQISEVSTYEYTLKCVRIPTQPKDSFWDVRCGSEGVKSIAPSHDSNTVIQAGGPTPLDGNHSFLLPSLCHPHIHLDKCFLFVRLFATVLPLVSLPKSKFAVSRVLYSKDLSHRSTHTRKWKS